jgi:membrane protein CcdC involved in cytochrome C biogenesis
MKLWLTALGVGVLVVRMSVAAPTEPVRTRGFSVPPVFAQFAVLVCSAPFFGAFFDHASHPLCRYP